MEVVPRYDLPPGTEVSVQGRKVTVAEKDDQGYEVYDNVTGHREFLPYLALVRLLQQRGVNIKKPLTKMSSKAALRLQTVSTHKALPNKQQEAGAFALAICKAISEIHCEIRAKTANPKFELSQRKLSDDDLRAEIAATATRYFGKRIQTRAPSGGQRLIWQLPKGRKLNEAYNTYRSCLKKLDASDGIDPLDQLVPLVHLRGNRTRRICWLVQELMTEALDYFAKAPTGNSIANVHDLLETLINDENKKRLSNDLPALKVPSEMTLSRHNRQLFSPNEALIRDLGDRAARTKSGHGSTDIPALKIGELTEMDEVRLSLIVCAKKCGLWEKLSDPDKAALEEIDKIIKLRLILLVLVDVATRMPLAWVISDEARAEATLALLRMATRDKTKEKIRYGCQGSPVAAVGLGMVKSDNGLGLRNAAVKAAILGVGGISVDVRTFAPTDKPYIERVFGTLESILIKILHGYTGRRPRDLPGYDAVKNGVLEIEALYELLTCFFIDELPSLRHHGFGMWGRRPAEVCKKINETRGMVNPIDADKRRIQLCWEESATPLDEGVRVFSGIWFNSEAFQTALDESKRKAKSGGSERVKVYVDPDDLNQATVVIRGVDPITVDLQASVFADMSINEVLNLLEACRKENPTLTEFYEDMIFDVRRKRFDFLDRIGVEKGLSRSYVTRAEIAAKARYIFRGSRVIPSQWTHDMVKAGQITTDNPHGMVFDFTDGSEIIDGDAVEMASSGPAETDVPTPPDPQFENLSPPPSKTAGQKPRAQRRAKAPTPKPEPTEEFFGRPTNPKRLE